jgi:hypothetical protein
MPLGRLTVVLRFRGAAIAILGDPARRGGKTMKAEQLLGFF